MQHSTHYSQQWDGWGSDRPLRPSSPSLTLPPPAPLLLSIWSLGISKQGPSSLASLHSSVVMQELLPKIELWLCTCLGHPWGSTHDHHLIASLAGCLESRCPFCVVLYLLRLMCPFIISPGADKARPCSLKQMLLLAVTVSILR